MSALALVGPTTSGKTVLSISLALRLGAEIVSTDSRQVYRGMDIGTDKATPADRERVPHHGLDLVDPGERYSAGQFARDARGWIEGIRGRGRVPLLVGGTGFFLRALTEPIFREPRLEGGRRERLRGYLSTLSVEEMGRWARALDPARAALATEGGRQRLARTLEVPLLTGHPLSWWHRHAPPDALPVETRIVRLQVPRDELHRRIDARARAMFEGGLLDEVRHLLERGITASSPGMTATGYREAAEVLAGTLSQEEAIARVQSGTRRYARRQETWFRNQLPANTFVLDATVPPADQVARVFDWWAGTRSPLEGVGSAPARGGPE
ncbi:MAG: tRNA (adenosine(37)-N6)-dimethylallyltransferase MiaA [Gemmatimonadota bacterium]